MNGSKPSSMKVNRQCTWLPKKFLLASFQAFANIQFLTVYSKICLNRDFQPVMYIAQHCETNSFYICVTQEKNTVDWDIFTLKIIRVKNFHGVKFSRFRSICEIFLTVDDCNMDKCLENSQHLIYYQVSGEVGIAGCSRHRTFTLGGVDLHVQSFLLIIAM